MGRLVWILRDADAACALDREQAVDAVVAAAREHDADDPGAVKYRGGLGERVDSRTGEVLLGPAVQAEPTALEDEMPIAWREVDPPVLDLLILGRLLHQLGVADPEHLGKQTVEHRTAVNDRDHDAGPWRGQRREELLERRHATGRCSDHGDVATLARGIDHLLPL